MWVLNCKEADFNTKFTTFTNQMCRALAKQSSLPKLYLWTVMGLRLRRRRGTDRRHIFFPQRAYPHRPHRKSSCRGSRWPGPRRRQTGWCGSGTSPCRALEWAPARPAWPTSPGHSSRGARHAASWQTFTTPHHGKMIQNNKNKQKQTKTTTILQKQKLRIKKKKNPPFLLLLVSNGVVSSAVYSPFWRG